MTYPEQTKKPKPIKVLAISVRADIGGGPEHLYQLTKHFGDKVQTIIACPEDVPYFERYQQLDNVEQVVEIPHRKFRLTSLWKLVKFVKSEKAQLIHSHGKGAGLYGRLLALLTRRPCIHTFHGLHVGEYNRVQKSIYLLIEWMLGCFTNSAICVSRGEKEQILNSKILPKKKLNVVHNGVVVPDTPSKRKFKEDGILKIVCVNRFDYQKNPELIIDIAKILKEKTTTPFQITVLGRGEKFDQIKEQIKSENIQEEVILYGPHPNPRETFRQSDVFLSTSRWEGMPLAVLEAMSEGLVVIASDVIGNRDIIENSKTGFLYPNEQPRIAADYLLNFGRKCNVDTGRFSRIQTIKHYSISRMSEETLKLYYDILDKLHPSQKKA